MCEIRLPPCEGLILYTEKYIRVFFYNILNLHRNSHRSKAEALKRHVRTMAMAVGIGEGNSVAGGGSLSDLYQNSRRLLLKSRDGLERLERFEYTSSSSSSSIPSSSSSTAIVDPSEQSFDAVRKEIAQIQSLCSEMELLWRSIPAKSQRDLWKRYASFSFFLVGF